MQAVDIIVFVRRPRAGGVKTRLAKALGGRRAAVTYAHLLRRTLAVVERSSFARRLLMPAAVVDVAYFRARYAHRGWQVRPQCVGDLGRRMEQALARSLAAGHAVVLIGSDIADFTVADLNQVRTALIDGADVALGPAVDGGYWLIGLSRSVDGMFRNMPWSSPRIYARTMQHLERKQLNWVTLATRRDIDTIGDLRGRSPGPRWRGGSP